MLDWRVRAQERDLPRHVGMQIDAAARHLPHRVDEQRGIVVLGDIALRPGLDRPRGEHGIVVHREDDDLGALVAHADAAAHFEAGETRQVEVDDGDVGLPGEIQRLPRVGVGRVAHLAGRVAGEQRLAAGNDDRMIVDDQHPHFGLPLPPR